MISVDLVESPCTVTEVRVSVGVHESEGCLDCLRGAGLKLKPSKCKLCSSQVQFLGHIVSADRVHTDPQLIEKVAQWPRATSRREVQQFLGLANYYRRFI